MQQTKSRYVKVLDLAIMVVACLAAIYHMVTVLVIFQGPLEHQIIHLFFVITLVALSTMRALKKPALWPLIALFLIAGWIVTAYMRLDYHRLEGLPGMPSSVDVIIGVVLIMVVIEGTRQAWGWIIPLLSVVFMLYFFFGHLLPGPLGHPSFSSSYIVSVLGIGFSGIFQMLGLSADQLFQLMLFSSVIQATGAMKFIMEAAKWASRGLAGGPAHTCVMTSALFGTVSGSAMANTMVTGAFTIPLMKKSGYSPDMSAAIEAAASTGGQIMPPIMGAVAFVMAGVLGVPYFDVMLAALVPAVLYYFSIAIGVQVVAMKSKLAKSHVHDLVSDESRPNYKLMFRTAPVFIIPVGIIVVGLLMNYGVGYVTFYAIVAMLVLACIQKETRPTWSGFIHSVVSGAVTAAKLGIILACLGIMLECLYQTSLGIKFSWLVEQLSFGSLPLALIIAMVVSLILGCAAPTIGAYILVAIVVSPLLVRLGTTLFAAHFFALYFACFSTITPPVAMASIAAASIAGGNYWKTGINAFKLALVGFIIPFVIIYNPALMLGQARVGESSFSTFSAIGIALIGSAALAGVLYNHFLTTITKPERLLYGLCALLSFAYIILSSNTLFVLAIALFCGLMFMQWRRKYIVKKEAI